MERQPPPAVVRYMKEDEAARESTTCPSGIGGWQGEEKGAVGVGMACELHIFWGVGRVEKGNVWLIQGRSWR